MRSQKDNERFFRDVKPGDTQTGSWKSWGGQTALHWAAYDGRIDMARQLIEKGANVNAKDDYQATPLHFAAEVGRIDIARLLIENGADLNAEDLDKKKPLIWAIEEGHDEFAKLLEGAARTNPGFVGFISKQRSDNEKHRGK